MAAIVEPRITRPDPANAIRRNVVLQEPHTCVRRSLTGPEHRVREVRRGGLGETIDRHDPSARRDRERRLVGRRDRRLQVTRIDDAPANGNIMQLPGRQIPDGFLRMDAFAFN